MGAPRKPLAGRASIAVAGVCAGLLIIELALATLLPQEDVRLLEWRDGVVFNVPEFENLFTVMPTTLRERLGFWPEGGPRWHVFRPRVRTNRRGERDEVDHPAARVPGRQRVLLLGDSMTFGWPLEELGDIYPKRLEKLVPGVEAINCSLIASHTAELERLFEKRCADYQADLVVVQLSLERRAASPDTMYLDRAGPDFRLIRALHLLREPGVDDLIRYDAAGNARLKELPPEVEGRLRAFFEPRLPLYRSSHLVRFVENAWLSYLLRRDPGPFQQRLVDGHRPPPTSDRELILPTLEPLLRLRDAARARGSSFLVLVTPSSYYLRTLPARADFERLVAELAAAGIEVLDMREVFRRPENLSRLDELYFSDDYHPKAPGHRVIAEALADRIRARLSSSP